VVDYRDPAWPQRVRELVPDGTDAAVDHTGGPLVRTVTNRNGTVVRTAWSGRSGHGRSDAVLGGLVANLRRYAHPRERLCSVPLVVALQPGKYRKLLHDQLNRIADGSLRGPTVTSVPFADVVDAHRQLATLPPGHKLVLEMGAG
jgi:NADPH2:quinone reductase